MSENSIKQVPFSRWGGKCPVCGKLINQKKLINIELHDSEKQSFSDRLCELFYCDQCDLPLIDGKISSLIYKETGMRPTKLSVAKNKLRKIKNQMQNRKITLHSQAACNKGYKVIGKYNSIWKQYKKLYSENGETSCPNCQQQLLEGETIIPIGDNSSLLVSGFVCPKCRSMFIRDADDISKMLKDNPYSADYYINDIAYWQYSELERKKKQEKRKKKREERKRQKAIEARAKDEIECRRKRHILDSIESSVVLISVIFEDRSTAEYIITTNKASSSAENAIHYSSTIGRELLTAAYEPLRKKRGRLNDKSYRIISVFPENEMSKTLIPSSTTIKTGGGFYSSVENKNYEIIDLLLYSPRNDIYECVHATYNKEDDDCFMDISIYRHFIKEFGNPGIKLDFPEATSAESDGLNEESILRSYGYSVSEKENLSSAEREELLTELVDLEILSVARIVHHLDLFIRLHPAPQYEEAVSKWTSDKAFIGNYKVNPARFMMSKQYV